MKVCGPKYALCGLIISAWGIVQLLLMGIFFFFRSVALIEDLPLEGKTFDGPDAFYFEAERCYTQNAMNCWIAACIYVYCYITLEICGECRHLTFDEKMRELKQKMLLSTS